MSAYKKMRFYICFLLIFSIFSVKAYAIELSAGSSILIDATSGEVLYSSNSAQKMPMASTTKIMTAVVAIESAPLDTRIKIPKEAVGIEGSSIYLCENEVLTLEELLYALLLASANDAATAIAISIGGGVDGFADMMNETAKRLGLTNTHFDNPHGLDSDSHYTTAKDLADLTAYALTLPEFKRIVSTYKHSIPFDNTPDGRLLVNHNKLLRSYQGAIGVKTGFTKKSGRCLVSAAERNGVVLIVVTLNAPDDWRDHTRLLDYGFDNYENVSLGGTAFDVPVVSGKKETVRCSLAETKNVLLPKTHGDIEVRMELYPFLYAPVNEGERIGQAVYLLDGNELCRIDIIATESVELMKQKSSVWDKIMQKINE